MRIILPFKTPTVNHLYFKGRILKTEARELRQKIITLVQDRATDDLKDILLRVTVIISEDWYYANGNVRRADVANREKFLIDSVFEGLGLDDKYIFEHIMIKKQEKEKEYCYIEINPFQEEA